MIDDELARVLGIRKSDLDQLRIYVRWAEEGGIYFNPKYQFDRRHARIKLALNIIDEKISLNKTKK